MAASGGRDRELHVNNWTFILAVGNLKERRNLVVADVGQRLVIAEVGERVERRDVVHRGGGAGGTGTAGGKDNAAAATVDVAVKGTRWEARECFE